MSKHNSLNKKIKKQILYVNNLIESNFNKLKYFKSNFNKILSNKDNRIFLASAVVVILTLSYFLIPTFYDKNIIQSQIKNQILKNYGIDVKFNEKINYGLLPKPHFSAKNLSILRNKNEIGITKNLKVFISSGQFFSINDINMKDLVFEKTDFNIYLDDFLFFKTLLQTAPNENRIYFKKSNIFFKNESDEVLFINKVYSGEFYYDSKNLQNVLYSKNEIFNIPVKIIIKNDKFDKKIFANFNSKKIRLEIENETNYENEIKKGLLNILLINKSTSLKYLIKKNSFSFSSTNNTNLYKGTIDLKPFYFSADFNYEGLSSKNLFNENSFFIDLINSEVLNNKNLSANFNIKVKDITNSNQLNNLLLKVLIQEGNINFSNSTIMWKDNLNITLNDSFLTIDDSGINLIGTIMFDFKDIDNFYSSFQIKKIHRKDINKVQLDFIYNLDTKSMLFDNPKVNESRNIDLDEFLNDFNSKENRVFNKITFKNFISNFFSTYSG
tara:strand:+ start:637 stop:2127 length:1491 start_codon:yes stop_codon:yes gene_type:complete